MVNTSQQVGGSIGTALLNTIAASAATAYATAHLPNTPGVAADAAVHSYSIVYLCASGFFAFGAVLTVLLFRRRGQGLSLSSAPAADTAPVATSRPGAAGADAGAGAPVSGSGSGSSEPVSGEPVPVP
jgi:hypothetical protein